jgi:hypothetical protein
VIAQSGFSFQAELADKGCCASARDGVGMNAPERFGHMTLIQRLPHGRAIVRLECCGTLSERSTAVLYQSRWLKRKSCKRCRSGARS